MHESVLLVVPLLCFVACSENILLPGFSAVIMKVNACSVQCAHGNEAQYRVLLKIYLH